MHPIGWQWEQWRGSRAPVWGLRTPPPNSKKNPRMASGPPGGPACVRCAGERLIGCRQPETGSGVRTGLLLLVEPAPKEERGGGGDKSRVVIGCRMAL